MPTATRFASLLQALAPRQTGSRWDLSAEAIAVQIRWFGLFVGLLIANFGSVAEPLPLNLILALGLVFTSIDTLFFFRKRVFLQNYPLLISAMEALFIGLLCVYESGPDSPFRFYYLLSLICCAMRYPPRTTFVTFVFDLISYTIVYLASPSAERELGRFLLMLVILAWIAWAAGAMARLLKQAGDDLRQLNNALRENQAQLETRIAERSRQLEESQAQVLHQEKMAAFGLLAAGIAHEVGNPLTSISSLVQMLERRDPDLYTKEKLGLVTSQLSRIQLILRELVTFSRPASSQRSRCTLRDIVDEALGIAKYYKGGKTRLIEVDLEPNLPPLHGRRDQLVQVVFNLVLNAIDATEKGGRIAVSAVSSDDGIRLSLIDEGHGIAEEQMARLFTPYFTTKKHGTGLGLFVTKRIVEQHGGRLSVTSEAGTGTTFEVWLPIDSPPSSDGRPRQLATTPTLEPSPPRHEVAMSLPSSDSRPRLLVVDDEPLIRDTLSEFLQQEGFQVAAYGSGEDALQAAKQTKFDIALCDVNLPGIDGLELLERLSHLSPETAVFLITAYATVESTVEAFQKGAYDYLLKPIILHEVLGKIRRLLELRVLIRENHWLRKELNRQSIPPGEMIIGKSPAMKLALELARKVAPTRSTVLILGESGSGKELMARAIHRFAEKGKADSTKFLAINCAAIPNDLLENQLFGHRRGAFTGADRDQPGIFAHAGTGTVFLDEIGEMPLATQAKLLRVIEQKEILPVGASEPVRIEARVLAATNKDLAVESAEGRFREDLYYRLNVVSITLPPLRERPEDLPELVDGLLAKHAQSLGKRFTGVSHEAMQLLMRHPWKGNVRELDNVIQRAVILGDGPMVTPPDLPGNMAPDNDDPHSIEKLGPAVEAFEKDHITRMLRLVTDKREAAKRLEIGLSSLYRKIEQYGIITDK